MKETLKCAIDSFPLADSLYGCYDYSGLQVNGLTSTPLSLHKRGAKIASDGLSVSIPLQPLRWEDGSRVTAADYRAGLQEVSNRSPFVKKYLLRKLKAINVDQEELKLELHRPNFKVLETLWLPNFAPKRAGVHSSGPYIRGESYEGCIEFQRNAYFDSGLGNYSTLTIQHVQAPDENFRRFQSKQLDVTADTAFPLERFAELRDSDSLLMKDSGLYAALIFGDSLSDGDRMIERASFSRMARLYDPAPLTQGTWKAISGPNHVIQGGRGKRVRLAFDDFYPNRQMCEGISDIFHLFGWETELIEDDYYRPHADYDLKFTLGRRTTPYLSIANQLFSKPLVRLPKVQKVVAEKLNAFEEGADEASKLKALIERAVVEVPLFRLPSLSMVRRGENNPLLRILEAA